MAYKLGLDAQLFHGTAGQTASSEMKNCKDVTLNLETGEADITTRAAEGWRITAATLKEASLEFEMVWDTSDAGFKAIKDAYFNNTAIALFASDGTSSYSSSLAFGIPRMSRFFIELFVPLGITAAFVSAVRRMR